MCVCVLLFKFFVGTFPWHDLVYHVFFQKKVVGLLLIFFWSF